MSVQTEVRGVVEPRSASAAARASVRRHAVPLACVATLVVHLLSLTRQLGVDEGGFAMVARHWREPGPFLYGPQWVDRPPGLIALFALAEHLGPYGVRLVAALLAVVLVAAVAAAAEAVGGRPAARWAAWTGFALSSSVLLEAQRLNGELAAATLVSVSVAGVLRAARASTTVSATVRSAAVAGGAAATAVLMKQSFVDAFAFAGVLVATGLATRENRLVYRPRRMVAAAGAFLAGAAAPAAATLLWARAHGGVHGLAYAMYGFRSDASAVMARWTWDAPLHRLATLVLLAWLSGLLFLLVHLGFSHRRRLVRVDPLPWAMTAAAGVELFGLLGGENFWPHYLIALIPTAAVAAGLSVHRRAPGRRWTRRLVVLSVAVTAAASPMVAIAAASTPSAAYTTGRWVASSAHRGDSLVVPYTHANVVGASGLEPAYPYSWSLPVRTLDPHLSLLTRTLDGPDAPTWVVRWDDPHSWGLDPRSRVDAALSRHYRPVATVCGHAVWLHDGARRRPAPQPPLSACGAS